jgi:hypothetical protein
LKELSICILPIKLDGLDLLGVLGVLGVAMAPRLKLLPVLKTIPKLQPNVLDLYLR